MLKHFWLESCGVANIMAEWDMTHAWLYNIHMQTKTFEASEPMVGNDVLNP